MQFELTGKVSTVLPEQRFNGKNGEVVKNSFVIEWQENGYEKKLCLEVMGEDKFEKMKRAVAVGNKVLVKYEATSREYNGKYYTTAACWYCANIGDSNANQITKQQEQAVSQQPQDDSNVPF